jgi:hypothetical protein
LIANNSIDRISYNMKTVSPPIPIQSNTPTAALRAAVLAPEEFRCEQGAPALRHSVQAVRSQWREPAQLARKVQGHYEVISRR